YQIDEGDDNQEDINRLVPLSRLVVRDTCPAEAVTVRQRLGGDLLDRLEGLPAAVAESWSTLNGSAGIQVISGDFVQALLLLDLHERRVRDHVPPIVLDEHVVQILGEPPELRRRLDIYLEELVEENEALLVRAANDDV